MTGESEVGLVAVVLAAGSGRRFGGLKQLAEVDGLPLVIHSVRSAREAGIASVIVVAGAQADRVVGAVQSEGVEVVVNPDHTVGQSTSLVVGLKAAEATDAQVALIFVADQPYIDPAVVRKVAATGALGHIARAVYDDGPGHPVALPRHIWSSIGQRVAGDEGARQLFTELDVVDVRVASPAPHDVDTPDDYDRLHNRQGRAP